jgi:hypothetical protein
VQISRANVHINKSEPSLANRRRYRFLGRPERAVATIVAQPNQATRTLIGRVGVWVGVHMPTASHTLCYLAIGSRSTVCKRRQGRAPHFDQDRLVVLVDSELDPTIGRPHYIIGKNVSSHSTGQSDSSNRSRGSRGPTVAICHLPLARPPSITTNPSPLKFIDWAVHSSVFRFFFAC